MFKPNFVWQSSWRPFRDSGGKEVHGAISGMHDVDDDALGHFAKLDVMRHALANGVDVLLYLDIDIVVDTRQNIPNPFEVLYNDTLVLPQFTHARTQMRNRARSEHDKAEAEEPMIAMYGQLEPKANVVEAIERINTHLRRGATADPNLLYWNTGVMVMNRAAMRMLVPLMEVAHATFLAKYGSEALSTLPFYDQGFMNALLWDERLPIRVRRLSFAWNTSHSKYAYHHGNRFWLEEPNATDTFAPYFYHFMGCASRKVGAERGNACKDKRIRAFLESAEKINFCSM